MIAFAFALVLELVAQHIAKIDLILQLILQGAQTQMIIQAPLLAIVVVVVLA